MKKVIIIGCPGSGKSTFARELRDAVGLPLYHLDMMFWNEDKTTVPKDVFIDRLESVLNTDEWIIDGNYNSTMEMRLRECDTVFFLDYPTDVCIDGIESRRGKIRSDMPWVEIGNTDEDFAEFVRKFNSESRPKVLNLLEKYSSKNIVVFESREDSEKYLRCCNEKLC